MNKDIWDKVGIIATFIQIVILGGFSVFISFYTAKMTNQLNTFKSGMDENTMIAKLVGDLTTDTSTNVKTDFALLALERYLKSSGDNKLEEYDIDMLTGFAQSIILERFFNKNGQFSTSEKLNEIFIESNFLQRTDSVAYNEVLALINSAEKVTSYPKLVERNINTVKPVNQAINSTNVKALGILFKKTCYIQYADANAKSAAEVLEKNLTSKSWNVPAVKYVPGNYGTIVRYFHPEDLELAKKVEKALNKSGVTMLLVSGYESSVPKGQLETWIGK